MANEKSFKDELLNLGVGYNKKGEKIVTGDIDMWLKKRYGANSVGVLREVTVAGDKKATVFNVHGSLKLDERQCKTIKYFFGVDYPVDNYIDIDMNVWGKRGESMAKFNLSEGDKYLFSLIDIKMNSFTRRDGSTGYRLVGNARGFKRLYSKNNGNKAGMQDTVIGAAVTNTAAAIATAPQIDYSDFDAVDDTGDLPF